ncbi:MAG: IPT/TIG domain-containing protein [Nitrospiria bacterium]
MKRFPVIVLLLIIIFPLLSCGESGNLESLPKVHTVSSSTGKAEGPVTGGTAVTITGTHLGHDSEVFFGDNKAASVVVQSATQLLATTGPVFRARRVPVTVTTGSQIVVTPDAFLYTPLAAFSSDRTGNFEIFTMAIDGTEVKQVTNNALGVGIPPPAAGEINTAPSFSPDGRDLVYESNKTGNWEVFIAGRTGTTPTNLSNDAGAADRDPVFSPDGAFILFTSDRFDAATNPTSDAEIFRMKRDGTELTQLTDNTSNEFEPTYSPDGNRIVFVSDRNGTDTDLYVMDSVGGNETRITSGTENDNSPTFSPDGSQVLFVRAMTLTKELYTVKSDGSPPVIQLTSAQSDASDPAFVTQMDGTLNILFSKDATAKPEIFILPCSGSSAFFVLSCDEPNAQNLTNHVNTDSAPSPSP